MILILALISPFLCFIIGLKNYRKSFSKYYVLVFILFYAFTITFPSQVDANFDFFRRIEFFNYYSSLVNITFTDLFSSFYSNDNEYASSDFIEKILIFFVSRLTDNFRWMTLVWALFFGLFFVNNIWFVIERLNLKINRNNIIWFAALFLIIPFWNINAFRFWTAAQIFIFGVTRFFYSRNKKYLLICFLSVFSHFSFIIPILLLIFQLLTPKNLLVANVFFIISFTFSLIDIQSISELYNFLPKGFSGKVQSYTSTYYLESVKEFNSIAVNFYVYLRMILILVAFELLFLFIYFKHQVFLKCKINRNLLFLSFILLGFTNFFFDLKPLDRFFNLGAFFVFFTALKFYKYLYDQGQIPILYRNISYLLIMFIVVEIRIGFDTISIASIIGNPITYSLISDVNFSLIEFFK